MRAGGDRRVFVHVGAPKTGTTYLQSVLWKNRSALAAAGVCYPLRRPEEHFAATMDLRQMAWGGRRDPKWEGAWERVAARARAWRGSTVVISNELLGGASVEQVRTAVDSLAPAQVHVVFTARDLARQLPSDWQEHLKHRHRITLDRFVADLIALGADAPPPFGKMFWGLHDPVDVLGRWGSVVPAQRVHVVTVPQPGAPPGLLWQRFASVVGIDADAYDTEVARSNTSLGVVETELLRRVNTALAGRIAPQHYDPVVRILLAEKVLAPRAGSIRLGLPAAAYPQVRERSAQIVAALRAADYDVAGDLEELIPTPAATFSAGAAQAVSDEQLLPCAVDAIAGMLCELGPMRQRVARRSDKPEPGSGPAPAARPVRQLAGEVKPERADGPPVVFLHIGAPKTGTTFLQDVLWHHRGELAADGVLFTRARYSDHFIATLDLRQVKPMLKANPEARGAWDRVAKRARSWPGTSIISHELFAAARPRQVRRALSSLQPAEVHLVYTVRDLWRQLPAEWQESTKHGRTLTFQEFLEDVIDRGRTGVVGQWFWSVHDATAVLRRWGASLPPERVHVITVPPSGAEPGLLWRRFAGLVGIDPDRYDQRVARPNTSLGAAEVSLLRNVNAAVEGRLPRILHRKFVKELLAQRILAAGANRRKIVAPAQRLPWARQQAERLIADIRAAGYDVVGDLDELRPVAPDTDPVTHPDDIGAGEVVGVAVEAVAALAAHMARIRREHGIGVAAGGPVPEAVGKVRSGLRFAREGLTRLARRVASRSR